MNGDIDMQTDSIVIFRNQLEALFGLTSLKDVKIVVRALIDYGMNGKKDVDMPDHLMFGWNAIKCQIDNVIAERERKLESYRERGRLGASAKHSQAMPSIANNSQAELGYAEQEVAEGGYNGEYNREYNNSVCVNACAHVRECEYAEDAERIAKLYPQGKTGSFRELLGLVIAAIDREKDLPGATLESAIAKVERGTANYANAMKGTPKRYLAKPEDFYGESRYGYDPEVWTRPAGNTGHPDVLRKNTAFAANERGLTK